MKPNIFLSFIFQTDKYFLYPIIFAIISTLILTGLFLFFQKSLPTQVPLYYSYAWGEQELTPKINYLILPGLTLLITLVNLLLAWQIHPTQTVLRQIILLSTIPVNLVILIAGIKILSIFVF